MSNLSFSVISIRSFGELGLSVAQVSPPLGISAEEAIEILRREAPSSSYSLNDLYSASEPACAGRHCKQRTLIAWQSAGPSCGRKARIGVVDSGVDVSHPALADQAIYVRSFPEGEASRPSAHGTAVAGLLVGAPDSDFPGLIPAAEIFLADALRADQAGGREVVNALDLVSALNWLTGKEVQAINLSLSGPDNALLAASVPRLLERQIALIAAVGNFGPTAPPAYPAAYRGVIAVTGVDADLRVYRWANRGKHVSFAAPGVDVWTIDRKQGGEYRDGTSFAAPFVTAFVADLLSARPDLANDDLMEELREQARDLGKPGRDPIYGWGLIQGPPRCDS